MKKTLLGALLIALAAVIFVGTLYIILEPLQAHYVEAGRSPSVLASSLLGIPFGLIVFTLFHVGTAFTKDATFGVEHADFRWKDLLQSKAYWKWGACAVGAGVLIFFAWSNYNF